jgi:FKBP-type peptidyl-prolyl cis-trans isomerase
MKKHHLIIIAGLLTGMFFTACNQKKSEYPGFDKTENGLYYKFITKSSDTTSPKLSDYLEVYMDYGTLNPDTLIFSSKNQNPQTMEIPFRQPVFQGDIYEGFAMMHVGDSARFLCNADSIFNILFRMPKPKELDSAKVVYFDIKLLNLKTAEDIQHEHFVKMEEAKKNEVPEREAYLKEHNINVKPTADGLYFIPVKKGTGKHPQPGDKVKVHYTGYLLNGQKFDSSLDRGKPFEFTLGKGQVIKGWDEGIAMLRKGGKATLIIPSELAYGQRSMGPIPPYATLVFDVELVDFTKGNGKK